MFSMAEKEKRKMGRPPSFTDSERKRRRKALDAKRRRSLIYLNDQFEKWEELKVSKDLDSHRDVAKFLLDQ